MKEVYIDFDGVILDTIPIYYRVAEKNKMDKASDELWNKFDFNAIINEKIILNDSIECIKKLIASNKYKISVLTCISAFSEGEVKVKFIRKYFDNIDIIMLPKTIAKSQVVCAKNRILIDDYMENLKDWKAHGGIPIKFSKSMKPCEYKTINRLDELLNIL